MAKVTFKIQHTLLVDMLAKGVFATARSDRSIENAVNQIKLLRISAGEGWVEVASIAPDIATVVRTQLPPADIQGVGCVCVNAEDLVKDIGTLQKPHTVTVEWDGHGNRQLPLGKVAVTAATERGRKTLTWAYDAYDPENVPVIETHNPPMVSFGMEELKNCVDSIGFAAQSGDGDGVLDNILLRISDGSAQLAATDAALMGIVTPAAGAHKVGEKKRDFILLNAGLLRKVLPLWHLGAEVSVIEDEDRIFLSGDGFIVRFSLPSQEIMNKYPAILVDRLMAMTQEGVQVKLDRLELGQATKAATVRKSLFCDFMITQGAEEVSADYRNAAKPALIGCSDATGTLRAPIRLSALGIFHATESMQGNILMIINPEETRGILRDSANPRLFFAFQHIKGDQ